MIAYAVRSRSLVRDYVALTKPRIISLLLLTALCAMFLAAGGVPEMSLVLLVMAGGTLAAGGANALNHYLDRDIDAMMTRTSSRPVPGGRLSPSDALLFGILLNAAAFVLFVGLVNTISAILALSATLFYVFVYTAGLKRITPQNIVIGGAAGAVPPMIGWTAVTGYIDLPAVYLFAIIFFWTPPHFWALSLLIKDDYKRAGIPMLPVVATLQRTKLSILLYTVVLVAITVLFFTTSAVGWVYFVSAFTLGVVFIYYASRLMMKSDIEGARGMYLYSLLYLALLFSAMAADSLILG